MTPPMNKPDTREALRGLPDWLRAMATSIEAGGVSGLGAGSAKCLREWADAILPLLHPQRTNPMTDANGWMPIESAPPSTHKEPDQ